MARINIYTTGEYTSEQTLAGWFDPGKADIYKEGSRWNGHNHIGILSGIESSVGGEYLYRTAGGRWVRYVNARNYYNGPESYEFLTDEQARTWLISSEDNDEVIEKYFGPLEDERGPGRPEVGKPINWRPGDDLLARVDKRAKERGQSRADTLRELVEAGLSA